jgi:Iap family predicted aminopeptidase
MADALRSGIPAITIDGMGPNGEMPYWHQVQDTHDKMDPQVMNRAYTFTRLYLQAIDSRSLGSEPSPAT